MTKDMSIDSLRRVVSIVRRILPPALDVESVSIDILLESWSNAVDVPSWGFIRKRCIDAIRSRRAEQIAMLAHEKARPHQKDHTLCTQDNDSVSKLVGVLSPQERQVIYYRFYDELPVGEIAERCNLDVNVVRQILTTAIFKMRQEAWEDGSKS